MDRISPLYSDLLQAIVPQQVKGHATSTLSSFTCGSLADADTCFSVAVSRLLAVNEWQQWAGKATAAFQLVDAQGHKQYRPVQKGDYFCIDLPGPGNPGGKGDDWVQVEKVGERNAAHQRLVYIRVRAARSPLASSQQAPHFFESDATSTFLVYQEDNLLIAAVYGRNEQPNVHQGGWLTRLRNWFVYLAARLGGSALQWKSLTKGLLQFDR